MEQHGKGLEFLDERGPLTQPNSKFRSSRVAITIILGNQFVPLSICRHRRVLAYANYPLQQRYDKRS